MSEESAELVPVPVDLIDRLQHVVGESDPDAMAISIVTVVEWMDSDGEYSMSLVHTPMPPWHMKGLMTFALENWECATALADVVFVNDDFEDEE